MVILVLFEFEIVQYWQRFMSVFVSLITKCFRTGYVKYLGDLVLVECNTPDFYKIIEGKLIYAHLSYEVFTHTK